MIIETPADLPQVVEPFDLLGAVKARQQQRERQCERERQQRAKEEQERKTRAEADLTQHLASLFPADVLAALRPLEIRWEGGFPYAAFAMDGAWYYLRRDGPDLAVDTGAYPRYNSTKLYASTAANDLIAYLANVHADYMGRLQLRALQAEEERERQQARAAAEEMHARCLQRVEEAKAALGAWPWPEGAGLRLYRWRWATSAAGDDSPADYDEAWSTAAHLVGGWVVTGTGRRLNLGMLRPGPIVEEYIFTSVEGLPAELRQRRRLTVPGIGHNFAFCDAEGDPLLCEAEDEELRVQHGYEPIPWVQALLRD